MHIAGQASAASVAFKQLYLRTGTLHSSEGQSAHLHNMYYTNMLNTQCTMYKLAMLVLPSNHFIYGHIAQFRRAKCLSAKYAVNNTNMRNTQCTLHSVRKLALLLSSNHFIGTAHKCATYQIHNKDVRNTQHPICECIFCAHTIGLDSVLCAVY